MENLKLSKISIFASALTMSITAGYANAAALQGRVGINPPTPVGQDPTGVIIEGTGIFGPEGNPLTDFDFVPPNNGGIGAVVEINANPEQGANDFLPFVGDQGTIMDVTALELLGLSGLDQNLAPTGTPTPIEDFIVIPGAFSFTLESAGLPEYSYDSMLNNTTVTLGAAGQFINLSDGSLDVSDGVGTFSVDFAGLTIAETQALFDEPGEIPDQFNPGTWSSNFVAIAPPVDEPEVVPEASSVLGLLGIGLIGGSFILRRKSSIH